VSCLVTGSKPSPHLHCRASERHPPWPPCRPSFASPTLHPQIGHLVGSLTWWAWRTSYRAASCNLRSSWGIAQCHWGDAATPSSCQPCRSPAQPRSSPLLAPCLPAPCLTHSWSLSVRASSGADTVVASPWWFANTNASGNCRRCSWRLLALSGANGASSTCSRPPVAKLSSVSTFALPCRGFQACLTRIWRITWRLTVNGVPGAGGHGSVHRSAYLCGWLPPTLPFPQATMQRLPCGLCGAPAAEPGSPPWPVVL
jgi:hypothetical protein